MKKGFTLIEIMVVIVIMGILAAVAVPKLFGNIAKAKVTEVPAAAGAYIKMQDVFLAEKTALGNWTAIGYVAPGNGKTNNFCYSQGNMTENTTAVDQQSETLIGWAASNIVALNDCQAGSWWSLAITMDGSNNANYGHNANSEKCVTLTTGWNVGTTMTGDCASTSVNEVKTETPKEEKPVEEKPAEEKPVVEETPPSPQQNYQQCYDQCYQEHLNHNGANAHGAQQSCANKCK